MLKSDFNQPKGSTIGVLRDGRTIQEAVDSVEASLLHLSYSVVLYPSGSAVTDTLAKDAAIAQCEASGKDLIIVAGNYQWTSGIEWNPRRYSIHGMGDVIVDVSGIPAGSYAVTLKTVHNGTKLWNNIAKVMERIVFVGPPTVNGIKIDSVADNSKAMNKFANLYFNGFNIGVYLGNNQWLNRFEHCGWRNTTNKIYINALEDSGENIQFVGCDFFGQNATLDDVCINHVAGNIEITFEGCSFDFMTRTLYAKWDQGRGIMRFSKCHFESRGQQDFEVDSANSWYHLILDGCDWTWDSATMPTRIGRINSTNVDRPACLTVTNCNFNSGKAFDLGGRELFTVLGQSILRQSGNNVISEKGNRGVIISRANRRTPFMDMAAYTTGTIYNTGSGTVSSSEEFPVSNTLFGSALAINGPKSLWTKTPVVGGTRICFAGNVKRGNPSVGVQLRFYDSADNVVGIASTQTDGATGDWQKFCQQYVVPYNAVGVRMQLDCSMQVAGEVTTIHSWMVEVHS